MCTYQTANLTVSGSGKGTAGWFPLTAATVYLDHPVDAPATHTLNIDFRNPDRGAAARVAVELDPAAARDLAAAILAILAAAPPGLLDDGLLDDGLLDDGLLDDGLLDDGLLEGVRSTG